MDGKKIALLYPEGELGFEQVEERFELLRPRRMAHLAQGLGLDLAYSLAGDLELAAHFLEGAAAAVDEAERDLTRSSEPPQLRAVEPGGSW